MTLRFFDKMPAYPPVFLEPGEAPEHEIAQMQVFVDGSRSMGSPFWTARYRILPLSASAGPATGEAYWIAGADSPVLEIEFQRDRDGRVTREILLGPQPQTASGNANRMQGWYEYSRDELGRVSAIFYHSNPGVDGRWLTDDDFVSSRVELSYKIGERNPKEARIFYDFWGDLHETGERSRKEARIFYDFWGGLPVRFDYDGQGRLTGGDRQDYWPTFFSVTSGSCSEIPERLFVLLLGPHGGPWHPFYAYARRGIRPAGPR